MAEGSLYIGSRLQKARRAQHININHAVEDLCIPKKYLSAFERNDLSIFPNTAYAVGFLKSYADYLGVEAASLVENLKAHMTVEPLDISLCRPVAEAKKPWLQIVAVVLLIGLVTAGAYFGWAYFKSGEYKLSENTEMPAHLAAFLVDETLGVAEAKPAALLANGGEAYFGNLIRTQNQNGPFRKVRVLAYADVPLAIADASGQILREGVLYSGESIDLPRGAGLSIVTSDYASLGFYLADSRADAGIMQDDDFYFISLDSLQPGIDKSTPAS